MTILVHARRGDHVVHAVYIAQPLSQEVYTDDVLRCGRIDGGSRWYPRSAAGQMYVCAPIHHRRDWYSVEICRIRH